MSNGQVVTAEQLDELRKRGIHASTHHSTLRRVTREVTGMTLDKSGLRLLRAAIAGGVAEEQRGAGAGFVARRKFPLLGHNYVPGDPVSQDGVRPRTWMLLIKQRYIVAGEVQ